MTIEMSVWYLAAGGAQVASHCSMDPLRIRSLEDFSHRKVVNDLGPRDSNVSKVAHEGTSVFLLFLRRIALSERPGLRLSCNETHGT